MQGTKNDFLNYLPNDVLVKVDRAAMANSLETRAPFLDPTLLEFAFSEVPSELKLNGSIKKYLLKKLAAKLLPADFEIERKQGFSIPLSDWLSSKWKTQTIDLINSMETKIIDKKYLLKMINQEGKWFKNNNRIYAILVLLIWAKKYGVEV